MLLQYHIKDPGYSAKSAGGKLQLNMHAPCVVYGMYQDGSSFMWHQPCQHCKYTTLVDIKKRAIKVVTQVESHASTVSLLKSGE